MECIKNFINGICQSLPQTKFIDNINPATGEVLCQLPDSSESDLLLALNSAQKAFPAWAKVSPEERAKILNKIAQLITDNLDELALAESLDTGKPLLQARSLDIPRSAMNFSFFAAACTQVSSQSHWSPQAHNYTLRSPLGTVACISPWNLPLYLLTWKIAPALAAGNCVIAKPSEITPLTAFRFSQLLEKSQILPPGVLNILHGLGAGIGEKIVLHPKISALSFTGGTRTGKHLALLAATQLKKSSLELGGKNPVIIFEDCDYQEMLETTLRSSFANQGQICLSGSRIFVEESLYPRFKKDFVKRAKELIVGHPLLAETQMGSVVSKTHLQKILKAIDHASEEGGKILTGGKQLHLAGDCSGGFFLAPTVIEGLSPYAQTNQQEIFGPVVTIAPFKTEEEVLEWANCTPYGLAATLWTNHLGRAQKMAEQLECGLLWVNCWMQRDLRTPFGGIKDSGMGREGGFAALEFFSETKNICFKNP